MNNFKLELKHLLLPSKPEITRYIVEHSCSKILYNFLNLAEYVLAKGEINAQTKENINRTIHYVQNLNQDSLFKFMSSPIFRGWYSKFGRVADFNNSDALFAHQIKYWNNFTRSFYYDNEIDDITFYALNGICFSWDSILTIACSGRDAVIVNKKNEVFRVYDLDKKQLLISFTYNKGSNKVSVIQKQDAFINIVAPKAFLPNSSIAVRNDISPLQLKLSGNLDRDNAIADELDFSNDSHYKDFNVNEFSEAASLIEANWNAEYNDFKETVQVVLPREVPHGWRARGMTVSAYQGAIWIMARGILPVFENLIHEQGHVKLRYIEEFVPILKDGQSDKRFKVAWRTDLRPLIGIYEGVYVHLHMLMGITLLFENRISQIPTDTLFNRIEHLREEVLEGLDVLSRNAEFTEEGFYFVEWANQMLRAVPA